MAAEGPATAAAPSAKAPAHAPTFGSMLASASAHRSSHSNSSHHASGHSVHFIGGSVNADLGPEFKAILNSPSVKLSDGAKLTDTGFRVKGGPGMFNIHQGTLSESLKGSISYTETEAGPAPITITAKNFKLEMKKDFRQAEIVGDVSIEGVTDEPLSGKNLDLADINLREGSFTLKNGVVKAKNLPFTLSAEAAQIVGIIPAGTTLGDLDFSIPVF
jgi:hypothetical protein